MKCLKLGHHAACNHAEFTRLFMRAKESCAGRRYGICSLPV